MADMAKSKQGLVELLGRALVDVDVRNQILNDPESVATQHGLSESDKDALKNINPVELEDAANRLGGHADFTISIGIKGKF
jgi:hypothetical protein